MLKITPDVYSQVRIRNGSSWLKSLTWEPSLRHQQPDADVEERLEQQGRDHQQPVPGDRLARRQHDADEHDHGQDHLLKFDDHIGERQRCARELQRPDQRQAVGDRREDAEMKARCVKLKTKTPVTRNAR